MPIETRKFIAIREGENSIEINNVYLEENLYLSWFFLLILAASTSQITQRQFPTSYFIILVL